MDNPLSTIEVLRAEATQIHGEGALDGVSDAALNRKLGDLGSTALCLSGGGIRSASFALGVIQALASRPRACKSDDLPDPDKALLGQFNYLSTVSGGGYIGGWLSAWLSRQPYADVLKALTGRSGAVGSIEPAPIGDLRRDSNYLTPKVGLVSADTWAAAAMVLRNLVLNWVLLVPLLLLVVLAVKLVAVGVVSLQHCCGEPRYGVALLVLAAASLGAVLFELRFTLRSLRLSGPVSLTQGQFLVYNLLPAVAAGLLWTAALDTLTAAQLLIVTPLPDLLVISALFGVLVFGAARVITLLTTGKLASVLINPRSIRSREVWRWLLSGAGYGVFLGFGAHLLGAAGDPSRRLLLLLLFGMPWLLLSQLGAETIYVALTSANPQSDEQREWFARSAGWYLAAGIAWILGVGLTLLGSWVAGLAKVGFTGAINWPLAGTVVTAVMGWLTGSSSRTPAEGPAATLLGMLYNALAVLAAPLFFALLLVLASAWLDLTALSESLFAYLQAYTGNVFPPGGMGRVMVQTVVETQERGAAVPRLLAAAFIIGLVAVVASKHININRFSLHGLYRNRLIRAFLGASHVGRKPDRFTGFDKDDNPQMADLWPAERARRTGKHWKPFHVLNLTLNLVSTRNLAWQQRKAMPFTVSPLHSGAAALGNLLSEPGGALVGYRGAYRPSSLYGGLSHQPKDAAHRSKSDPSDKLAGISLGTAMAISGAAANPNMGYHSSPVVSLLLTLLNVRLGWWLGNPGPAGEHSWYRNGPPRAALPIVMDAFGQTTSERPYVSLSDGGHFENLGLYEMVRRRCRYIVVSDASCDPTFTYADLGDSVRKIAIDFGIPVRFHRLQDMKPRLLDISAALPNVPYHAIGIIDYRMVDGPDAKPGIVLYVKASFHNCNESAGVKAYANAHPVFPHEPTSDQWFDESQFESYRALGYEIMDGILSVAQGCSTELAGLKQVLDTLAADALKETCEECDPPVGSDSAPSNPSGP